MTARYPIVLLDLDRTLFDFAASERLSFEASMRAVGIDATSHFDRYLEINHAAWARVERGELTPAQAGHQRMVDFLADLGRSDVDPARLSKAYQRGLGAHGELYPAAPAVLDALAEHAELALVTNGIAEVQREKIARLGLDRWFTAISISGELGVAKPDPAIFDHALNQCRRWPMTNRSAVLMVGDSIGSDVRGAQRAGLSSCWLRAESAVTAPPEVTITHTIERLDALPPLLNTPIESTDP